MNCEIIEEIPGYEGVYSISSYGYVISEEKVVSNGNGFRTIRERVLKGSKGSHGYLMVALSINGNVKKYTIHQLMAITFLSHTPNSYKGFVVDHIDNNKLNNSLDNLQLTTVRHNTSKDKKNVTSKYTGVSWWSKPQKWIAQMRDNGERVYLGAFNKEIDAHNAYQKHLKTII